MSKSQDTYLSNYKTQSKWKANREAKLLRALKRNPGNVKQIELAISNIRYRRRTPTNAVWSKSNIRIAKILKEFTGSAPLTCFSSNPEVAKNALAALTLRADISIPSGKVSFSLGDRL